ncbi:MAG: hypothetical protein ABJM16_04760 [Parasphingorhabdus sp.]|uniref:hypothetical protein n=2 Tax=Parasphingorhabdus sp. TaxID=2709688 RepID=UPI00329A3549
MQNTVIDNDFGGGNMENSTKAPMWFWALAIIALIWNGLGVGAYFQQMLMSAEDFAALPELQRNLLISQPFWATAAFAIAVFAGFAGAITMLMRKRITVRIFILSFVAVLVQISSYFILDGYLEFISSQGWTMPILIPVFALAFILFARKFEKDGILS